MNRFVILCLFGASILGACSAAQVSVTTVQTDDPGLADLIAHVKDTPVSQLDKNLPDVGLLDWILAEAGPDAKIGWSYTPPYMGLCWNNTRYPHCACGAVDVAAKTWDGREFFVQIAAGSACTTPSFDSGMVAMRKRNAAFIRHLSDLPRLLWKDPGERRHIEDTR
jgi:hypothetical protein